MRPAFAARPPTAELALPSDPDMSAYLRRLVSGAPLGERLKVVYRPYICPMRDVLEHIPPGAAVLDIGCGGGALLSLVAEFRAPRAVCGVEVSAPALAAAREVLRGWAARIPVALSTYDGAGPPPEVRQADVVTMVDVLHHIPRARQDAYLAQLADALRPGARFILKDIDAARPVLVWMNRLHDLLVTGERGHERTRASMEQYLVGRGLTLTSVRSRRKAVYPHYTIVADKPA